MGWRKCRFKKRGPGLMAGYARQHPLENAAVERRVVRVRRSGRPRRKAWTLRALLGAPLPHVGEGNGNEGAPRALQTTGAAERWLNALPAV